MKIKKKWIIFFGLFLLFIGGIILYLEDAGCKITVIEEKKSPNGKYIARAIIKDCGATTAFSTQVRVQIEGVKLFEQKVFWGYRSENIHIDWLNNELQIYSDCSDENIFLSKKKLFGIPIKLVRLSADPNPRKTN